MTAAELQWMFNYKDGGILTWAHPSKFKPWLKGRIAGVRALSPCCGKYYWQIGIGGRTYKRSRLIFCMTRGYWPRQQIDHIDGDSLNDTPSNLREASHAQNMWNRKTARPNRTLPMGVRLRESGRFQAAICVHRIRITLGTYATIGEAHAAYTAARAKHFGEFA